MEKRFRYLWQAAYVESSLDAIISKDLDGVITSWNPAAAELFGFGIEEVLGRRLAALIIPPDLQQEEVQIQSAARSGFPLQIPDTRRMRKDGTVLPVSVSVAPIFDEQQAVVGVSVTMRDISQQKEAARALAGANEALEQQVRKRTAELTRALAESKDSAAQIARLNSLLEGVLDSATEVSVIATGLDGTIELFNRGAERMLGFSAQELVGLATPAHLCRAQEVELRAAELSKHFARSISGFETFVAVALEQGAETRVWTCSRKDGRTFPISLTVTAIHDGAGAVTGFLCIGFDISKQREVEESLLAAKNMAEQASRSKSQFVANMSHEIRTPMNAVLGLLQVLQRSKLDAGQLDCVNKAAQAGKALLGLINDVLDFSKLEAEHLVLDQHNFELDAMLQEVVAAVSGAGGKSALEIMLDAPPSLPQILVGDSLRLGQVLVNLLGNAIKFTPQGHVLLRVESLGRHEGHARLRFSVSDTGIGIPASQREQVFGEFTQAEASTTRRFGGTGLGLAISRRLVGLMGGVLQLDSQEQAGSCFWFELDLLTGPEVRGESEFQGRMIAAAGNPLMRDLLGRLLPELGWQADIVVDSETMLARVAQQDHAGHPYRLALLGTGRHGAHGQAFEQAWRQLELKHRPAFVMLAVPGSAEAGVAQPFTASQLERALQAALRDGAGLPPESGAAPRTARRLADLCILVVEDQPLNRMVAERLLAYEGATVLQADGGASGVAIANRHCAELDLILMDLQMPDMDGFSATKAIQSNPATAHIPVIAMTANASVMDRKACLQAGMVDHIGKPIDIEQVVRVLSGHIARTLEQHAPGMRAEPAAAARLETMDGLLQRFGGSLEVYEMALGGFEAAGAELLDALERHCAAGNAALAAGELHALRGVAATLGATGYADQCAAMEQALKEGGTTAAICGAGMRRQLREDLAAYAQELLRRLPGQPAAPGAGAAQDEGVQQWLEEIRSMLEFGCMDALDKLNGLLPLVEEEQRPQVESALAAVAQLQFEQAAALLHRIGESLEAQC